MRLKLQCLPSQAVISRENCPRRPRIHVLFPRVGSKVTFSTTMQPNVLQPTKQVEEKRSKWKLFAKGIGKSSERLVEAGLKHSDTSATNIESHRSSATDESRSLIDGSIYNISPREAYPTRGSAFTAGRGSNPGLLRADDTSHNTSPKEVHPGLMITQSGVTIEKVFQPQSVLSSSSTPSVRQETYTNPITGEITTKTITTVVTETTTTQTTKPYKPPTDDELDVDEERRLATEYLAASESHIGQESQHGLQPPPKPKASTRQRKGPTAISTDDALRPLHSSSGREQPDQWSSDCQSPGSNSCDRRSSETENHLPQQGPNYLGPRKPSVSAPRSENSRKVLNYNATKLQVKMLQITHSNNVIDGLTRHSYTAD